MKNEYGLHYAVAFLDLKIKSESNCQQMYISSTSTPFLNVIPVSDIESCHSAIIINCYFGVCF